jgi:glyoxalase superfamily protein
MAIPIQVTFDCADPERVGFFWADALGYKLQDRPEVYASWSNFLSEQRTRSGEPFC